MHWYRASKTLAERAAWKYVEENKPDWDLVTVCPPYVLGPIIHEAATPESLNTCELFAKGGADQSRGQLVFVSHGREDDRRRHRTCRHPV